MPRGSTRFFASTTRTDSMPSGLRRRISASGRPRGVRGWRSDATVHDVGSRDRRSSSSVERSDVSEMRLFRITRIIAIPGTDRQPGRRVGVEPTRPWLLTGPVLKIRPTRTRRSSGWSGKGQPLHPNLTYRKAEKSNRSTYVVGAIEARRATPSDRPSLRPAALGWRDRRPAGSSRWPSCRRHAPVRRRVRLSRQGI